MERGEKLRCGVPGLLGGGLACPCYSEQLSEPKTWRGVPTSKGADRMIDRSDDLLGCTIVSSRGLRLLKRHHLPELCSTGTVRDFHRGVFKPSTVPWLREPAAAFCPRNFCFETNVLKGRQIRCVSK
ncbi:unnamed protein product [Pleuronectes platessa]|uniref:Uncharacterized protein n=1 Tax=Pleuronectes platessa TaxID=8262 RepID=A0A9N7YUR9_PLEPL|nr:unnamed protein product [Pleuronectes platessa]